MTTVPTGDPWADITAALRRLADNCADLIGQPGPRLIQLDIQPYAKSGPDRPEDRAETIANVNTVASALLGVTGNTKRLGSDTFHHKAHGPVGPVVVSIYQSVADPSLVDPNEEIARLRAENERLRAALPSAGGVLSTIDGSGNLVVRAVEPVTPVELLAIAPGPDGGVAFAVAPAGAVTDPVARAKVVEMTEAVAADPTGLAYTRADDGETPQPAAGRLPAHLEDARTGEVEMVDSGALVDETEAPAQAEHDGPGIDCRRCESEGFEGVRHDRFDGRGNRVDETEAPAVGYVSALTGEPVCAAPIPGEAACCLPPGHAEPCKPLVSAATIAEVAALEERDRLAGGPPWETEDAGEAEGLVWDRDGEQF